MEFRMNSLFMKMNKTSEEFVGFVFWLQHFL